MIVVSIFADGHEDQDGGFSLVEMLVSLALTLLVLVVALWLLAGHLVLAESLPQAADVDQRSRLALALVRRDLMMAGTGPAYGRWPGPLRFSFPSVVPRRIGLAGTDPYNVARPDAVTILWAPDPAETAEIVGDVSLYGRAEEAVHDLRVRGVRGQPLRHDRVRVAQLVVERYAVIEV